ncbi:MAG: hypothetical protein AAF414_04070 [Pseudomonadota bacterium]
MTGSHSLTFKPAAAVRAVIILVVIALFGGVASTNARAQSDSFLGFVETYYRNGEPEEALDWMERIAPTMMDEVWQAADPQGQRFALVAAFFAHILHNQPSQIPLLTERLIANDEPNLSALGALSIASSGAVGVESALNRLRQTGTVPAETVQALAATPSYPFPTMQVTGPTDLELMWLSFYATGNPLYVRRVAEAMGHAEQGDAGVALAAFAYASLAERVTHHPAVVDTLRSIAAQRRDLVGHSAAELVSLAEGG